MYTHMYITRINSNVFKYNQQIIISSKQKNNFKPTQTQIQHTYPISVKKMQHFANLAFGQKEQKETIFSAIREYDIELLKQLKNKNPKTFAKLISTPEDQKTGYTPVHIAVSRNNTKALKFMEETAPDEFKKALLTKARDKFSPIYLAVSRNNPEALQIIKEAAPEIFSKAITEKLDTSGSTIVHHAIDNGNNKALKFIVKSNPDEFKWLLINNKSKKNSPIFYAADRNNTEALQIIKETEPEIFSEAVTDKYEYDRTLVHITADSTLRKNSFEFLAV